MSKQKNNDTVQEEETPSIVQQSIAVVKDSKALLKKYMEAELKMVRGTFRCLEVPGTSQRIQVRKYPGIPMFDKVMEDGKMYEIPLYVARHLNGIDVVAKEIGGKIHTCQIPSHGFKIPDSGQLPGNLNGDVGIPIPLVVPVKWTRRYAFDSNTFDVED